MRAAAQGQATRTYRTRSDSGRWTIPTGGLRKGETLPQASEDGVLRYYHRAMAVRKKRSISLPPNIDVEIAAQAAAGGVSYSAWLAAMVRRELTIRAGLAAAREFEKEHGAFSPEEFAEAAEWAAGTAARAAAT